MGAKPRWDRSPGERTVAKQRGSAMVRPECSQNPVHDSIESHSLPEASKDFPDRAIDLTGYVARAA